MLPLVIATFIFSVVATTALTMSSPSWLTYRQSSLTLVVAVSLFAEIIWLFVYTLLAVIASRLYQRLGVGAEMFG
jgi:hypothetical protein